MLLFPSCAASTLLQLCVAETARAREARHNSFPAASSHKHNYPGQPQTVLLEGSADHPAHLGRAQSARVFPNHSSFGDPGQQTGYLTPVSRLYFSGRVGLEISMITNAWPVELVTSTKLSWRTHKCSNLIAWWTHAYSLQMPTDCQPHIPEPSVAAPPSGTNP